MGGIGPEKILLLLLVVLLLFGAKRLPEIGQSLGKGIREFKGSLNDSTPPPPAPPSAPAEPAVRREHVAEGPAGEIVRREEPPTREPKRLIT